MSGKDVEDIWKGDLLGRKDDGIYLQRFIENSYRMDTAHQNSFVLNINSEWGSGKTWFLERFAKQLKQNHPVVYFDAWKNDFTQDPLTSLIAVICQSMEEQFSSNTKAKQKVALVKRNALKFIKPSLPVVLAALVKHYSGVALLEESEETESDSVASADETSSIQDVSSNLTRIAASEAMNSFYKQKKGIDEFIEAMKSFVTHLSSIKRKEYLPICIFIDELDRCRPTYAIELLEAVKHIFSIGGLFFIIATDSKQLAYSINAVYGQKFDSSSYLKRFFYTEYSLSTVDYERMAKHLVSGFELNERVFLPQSYVKSFGFDGYFSKNARFFQLTPREQEQLFVNFKNCVLSTEIKKIHYVYILFLLSLKLKHENIYLSLMQDNDSKEYDAFMKQKGAGGGYSIVGLMSDRDDYRFRRLENPKNLDFADVVNFYSRLRGKTFGDILKMNPEYIFQEEILSEFNKEREGKLDGVNGMLSLSDYFFLITQAGRLISKI